MNESGTPQKSLTKEQKTGFVLLLIFAVLTVGLGFLQLRNTIYSPFLVRPNQPSATADLALDETIQLQKIDTDRDGLTDYDEFEFYKTSPYLPDTDSDGVKDKVEIENGDDPLCPRGEDCGSPDNSPDIRDVDGGAETLLNEENSPLQLLDNTASLINSGEAIKNVTNQPAEEVDISALSGDVTVLRQLLLSTGAISEEQLNQIDDETILGLAKEVEAQTTGLSPTSDQ